MRSAFTDAEFPATPYPGARPDCSFVHVDATGWPLRPDPTTSSGWRVEPHDMDLDAWLAARGEVGLTQRFPVLAYGSNACPGKITWLRESLGLPGPAVVLRARCEGLAAVWAAGLRVRDGQRSATLSAAPGLVEEHAVWLATTEQLRVLDVCEGRGERYQLVRLHTGRVLLDDASTVDCLLAYTGLADIRLPLLVDGAPVRCAELPQAKALALNGIPASSDGLDVCAVDRWPGRTACSSTARRDLSNPPGHCSLRTWG